MNQLEELLNSTLEDEDVPEDEIVETLVSNLSFRFDIGHIFALDQLCYEIEYKDYKIAISKTARIRTYRVTILTEEFPIMSLIVKPVFASKIGLDAKDAQRWCRIAMGVVDGLYQGSGVSIAGTSLS